MTWFLHFCLTNSCFMSYCHSFVQLYINTLERKSFQQARNAHLKDTWFAGLCESDGFRHYLGHFGPLCLTWLSSWATSVLDFILQIYGILLLFSVLVHISVLRSWELKGVFERLADWCCCMYVLDDGCSLSSVYSMFFNLLTKPCGIPQAQVKVSETACSVCHKTHLLISHFAAH